jgi:malate dehydrogenase (oxaloacetate-decarboxylating)(NADP+)
MSDSEKRTFTDEDALAFHKYPTPGKIAVVATKPMATQRDLSLAYSPGVAVPVLAIAENPDLAYDYTSKGNLVAVISNGTAILGLGDLGALASKPVMEGKAVLFKRFADVDSIDIELLSKDPDEIITVVKNIGVSFGGINLEDIKAPECFRIETELQELLDIPVFHDDQHGTAIISAAGLINACHITGRRLEDVKLVLCGVGAAGIASLELMKAMGVRAENCIAVDTKGVIYRGRTAGRGDGRGGRLHRPLGQGHADAGDGRLDGPGADYLRHGQSRSGDHPGRGVGGAARRDHGHRPVRLSQPGQQRPGLPLHLPRRA